MKFIVVTTLITILIVLSAGIGYSVYAKVTGGENSFLNAIDEMKEKGEVENETFNFLVLGIDELGIHTDTVVLVNFDSIDKNIDIVSLPRDLKIDLTQTQQENLKYAPKTVKLTEVFAYAGSEKGVDYTTEIVESIVKEKIDFWVTVDLEAFRYLVDEVGGVEFDVPINMYYNDPYQDLYINIEKGLQTLDGEKAEQLIRFRSGYANGDLGRIAVQQDFLKALMGKFLSSEDKVANILAIGKTALKYTSNNIALDDITNNIKYIDDIDFNNIRTFTLPVENTMINGKSYVELLKDDFYDVSLEIFSPINDDTEQKSSENLNITVLNGSDTNGVANDTKELLEKDGFKVLEVGNYNGTKKDYSRIYVKNSSYGKDLQKYFDESKILLDENLTEDIKIVVGLNGTTSLNE